MIVKLLTEHLLECLSLKEDCRGSSESTYVKMPHCWKSHEAAHIIVRSNGNIQPEFTLVSTLLILIIFGISNNGAF